MLCVHVCVQFTTTILVAKKNYIITNDESQFPTKVLAYVVSFIIAVWQQCYVVPVL